MMTVRQVLELLSYGTYWRLVGARTGKILCTCFNKQPTKEKYMELTVTNDPIKADFYMNKSKPFTQYVRPMISIWVSGE